MAQLPAHTALHSAYPAGGAQAAKSNAQGLAELWLAPQSVRVLVVGGATPKTAAKAKAKGKPKGGAKAKGTGTGTGTGSGKSTAKKTTAKSTAKAKPRRKAAG